MYSNTYIHPILYGTGTELSLTVLAIAGMTVLQKNVTVDHQRVWGKGRNKLLGIGCYEILWASYMVESTTTKSILHVSCIVLLIHVHVHTLYFNYTLRCIS